jgi:hypothetical protein
MSMNRKRVRRRMRACQKPRTSRPRNSGLRKQIRRKNAKFCHRVDQLVLREFATALYPDETAWRE